MAEQPSPLWTAWNRVRYSLYAPFYNLLARPIRHARRRAVRLLQVRPGHRVLIVGCGTGLDLEFLPPGVSITAVDISPAMVRKTSERARRLGLDIHAEVMDGEHLSFEDGRFDRILLHLILAVIPDPAQCARESARVLARKGRISVWDKFLSDGAAPGVWRRLANPLVRLFFTDINRQLGPLLAAAGLCIRLERPSYFNGLFKIVIAEKPQD